MKTLPEMLILLFDVSLAPSHSFPWVTLVVLLGIVFILAVSFSAGLVYLLIRLKRRKAGSS